MYRLTQRGARAAPQCSTICQSCLLWQPPCGRACLTQSLACPRRGSRCFRTCHPRWALTDAPVQRPLHEGNRCNLSTARPLVVRIATLCCEGQEGFLAEHTNVQALHAGVNISLQS